MKTNPPTQKRIKALQAQNKQLEDSLTGNLQRMYESLNVETLLSKIKRVFASKYWRKRMLYGLGAAAVVFLLLRGAMRTSKPASLPQHTGAAGDMLGKMTTTGSAAPRGFWVALVQEAIQVFLLSYAKRVLQEYITRNFSAKHAD